MVCNSPKAAMNYQHLLCFRTVAVLGGVNAAARQLRLSPPLLNARIRSLEESIGVALFARSPHGLTLTESGHLALRYADRIFGLGDELERELRVTRTIAPTPRAVPSRSPYR